MKTAIEVTKEQVRIGDIEIREKTMRACGGIQARKTLLSTTVVNIGHGFFGIKDGPWEIWLYFGEEFEGSESYRKIKGYDLWEDADNDLRKIQDLMESGRI